MESARFTIPTPALLARVVDMIDKVPMDDRDTKGDLYEYMLGKIASTVQNGQFRTPNLCPRASLARHLGSSEEQNGLTRATM